MELPALIAVLVDAILDKYPQYDRVALTTALESVFAGMPATIDGNVISMVMGSANDYTNATITIGSLQAGHTINIQLPQSIHPLPIAPSSHPIAHQKAQVIISLEAFFHSKDQPSATFEIVAQILNLPSQTTFEYSVTTGHIHTTRTKGDYPSIDRIVDLEAIKPAIYQFAATIEKNGWDSSSVILEADKVFDESIHRIMVPVSPFLETKKLMTAIVTGTHGTILELTDWPLRQRAIPTKEAVLDTMRQNHADAEQEAKQIGCVLDIIYLAVFLLVMYGVIRVFSR